MIFVLGIGVVAPFVISLALAVLVDRRDRERSTNERCNSTIPINFLWANHDITWTKEIRTRGPGRK